MSRESMRVSVTKLVFFAKSPITKFQQKITTPKSTPFEDTNLLMFKVLNLKNSGTLVKEAIHITLKYFNLQVKFTSFKMTNIAAARLKLVRLRCHNYAFCYFFENKESRQLTFSTFQEW